MKLVIAVTIVFALVLLWWLNMRIDDFTARCERAGGHAHQYGTAMSSWMCLSPDGRILEVGGA